MKLIAQQAQALQTLRRLQLGASGREVENWIEKQSKVNPKIKELDLERFPEAVAWLHEQVAFRLSWQRYLAKHLTEKNLQRHFDNQLARFDGTRFEVQLMSARASAGTSKARSALLREFEELAKRVSGGDLQWSDLEQLANKREWAMGNRG